MKPTKSKPRLLMVVVRVALSSASAAAALLPVDAILGSLCEMGGMAEFELRLRDGLGKDTAL